MAASPLISVIVPIYNVEPYLDACVSSIAEQSYTNLEIILVDDGSPDRCPEMCDRWAEKDPRVRVIHKSNGGLSDARNCGMEQASGDYLSFVDGDDTIAPDFISDLHAAIVEEGSQISMCSMVTQSEGACTEPFGFQGKAKYKSSEAGLRALITEEIATVACNKLYDRAIMEGVFFPKGKYHEDVFWSYQIFGKTERSVKIGYPGYIYRQRGNSIMGAGYSSRRLDAVEALCQRQHYLDDRFPALSPLAREKLLFACLYHGQNAMKALTSDDLTSCMDRLKTVIKEYRFSSVAGTSCKFTHKIWLILEQLSFTGTCRLRNFLKIGL